jgi:branched-chain amino acid transport system substrate-binding protein
LKRKSTWARRAGVGRTGSVVATILVLIVIVAAIYIANANRSPSGTCTVPPSSSLSSSNINIGYISEITGTANPNGYAARIGAELAVNQTNAAGGIDGKDVNLVFADDQSNPQVAVQCASGLSQDGVLALTGPTTQSGALAVEGYTEANGIPFVVSTVSSAALISPGMNWTVAVEPDAVQWGAAAAKYVSQVVPNAKIALMTQNSEQQNEMSAGVRWYANTYKNESIVFDQEYANAQFAWATAATAVKFSGANAVVVSWLSSVGFSESNVIEALLSAGFLQNQIFVVSADSQVGDIGSTASGTTAVALFDGAMATGYPNATAFVNKLNPFLNSTLDAKEYCGICPTDIGPIYYYSYLGMEMMINSIRSVMSSGQTLTRADFMSAMKHASIEDAFGNTVSIQPSGASVGSYYIVVAGTLNSTASTYPFELVKTIRFSPGTVPAYQLARTA